MLKLIRLKLAHYGVPGGLGEQARRHLLKPQAGRSTQQKSDVIKELLISEGAFLMANLSELLRNLKKPGEASYSGLDDTLARGQGQRREEKNRFVAAVSLPLLLPVFLFFDSQKTTLRILARFCFGGFAL